MSCVADLVEGLCKAREDLESALSALLGDVFDAAWDCARNATGEQARERARAAVIEAHVRRETARGASNAAGRETCKGKCETSGQPCRKPAKSNGFCKLHAGQYERYAAAQRAAERHRSAAQAKPAHNHPRGTVPPPPGECPACDARRRENLEKNI